MYPAYQKSRIGWYTVNVFCNIQKNRKNSGIIYNTHDIHSRSCNFCSLLQILKVLLYACDCAQDIWPKLPKITASFLQTLQLPFAAAMQLQEKAHLVSPCTHWSIFLFLNWKHCTVLIPSRQHNTNFNILSIVKVLELRMTNEGEQKFRTISI